MILSVSRRTDIPAFYMEWFMNRLREGIIYVKNPMNPNLISSLPINSENVDCIVFWTKNPTPILEYLDEIDNLGFKNKYYFQITITPYHNDIEINLENKSLILDSFKKLSDRLDKDRMILRYDPILLNDKYTIEYHVVAFNKLIKELSNYTNRVVISFIDNYKKIANTMKEYGLSELSKDAMLIIAEEFSKISKEYNISIETCAESIDLSDYGINPTSCIDGNLIEKILGKKLKRNKKDNYTLDGTRVGCNCIKCIDIGEYNSCIHKCIYCYANYNHKVAYKNYLEHDPNSKILIGNICDNDIIKPRKDNDVASLIINDKKSIIYQPTIDDFLKE